MFFVISGFLISGIIFGRLDAGAFSFREFYARRIARIFPALVVVLAAVLLLGWLLMLGPEYKQTGKHVTASAGFLANEVFRWEIGYFDTAAELKPLLHLWSLGVEEQFYLLWAPLLWLAARRGYTRSAIAAIAVASLTLSLVVTARRPTDAFYLTSLRLWELALGGMVAWLMLRGRLRAPPRADLLSWAGLAMIGVACVAYAAFDPFPGWRALLPTAGAALVIVGGEGAWLNRRVLANRAVVYVGLISYPLYLWHWVLLSFTRLTRAGDEPSAWMLGAAIVAAVLLSALTYHLVERPIRFGAKPLRWRTPALVSAMLVVAAAGLLAAFGRIVTRPERELAFISKSLEGYGKAYRGQVCLLDQEPGLTTKAECEDRGFGDSGRTSILIWGDSHAGHLYPGFAALAGAERLALAQHTMGNCVPVIAAEPEACAQFSRFVLGRVAAGRPNVVVLASRWHQDLERLPATIAALRGLGVWRVVVVGPVPRWTSSLPRLVVRYRRANGGVPERMRFGEDTSIASLSTRVAATQRGSGAVYVAPLDLLCNSGGCLVTLEGVLTAWDQAHLTEPAARLLARRILEASRATP